MIHKKHFQIFLFFMALSIECVWAQNPIIRDQFSADPTARIFNGIERNGKYYFYLPENVKASSGKGFGKPVSLNHAAFNISTGHKHQFNIILDATS